MKILLISNTDFGGGAARATLRLHKALIKEGIMSQMIVQFKVTDDPSVIQPERKMQKFLVKLRPFLDSIPVRFYKQKSKTLFSPNWVPLSFINERIKKIRPDLVHIHWVGSGLISIEDISRIKVPIVWSLHDMWAFTGGCHYNEYCNGFLKKCGNCPVLGSTFKKDLSRITWLRKESALKNFQNVTFIGLSKWMSDCAKSSSLLKSHKIITLPNPLDTAVYSPVDRLEARRLFNLPQDKKLILFGAIGATSDSRKGFKELVASLHYLSSDYELVVFGSNEPVTSQGFRQKATYLGHLYDDVSLRVLYSAADVMVVPSLQENLSNAIMESLACGTPVVGFNIGGNSDMVEHKINGYLAEPFNSEDLADGVKWVLEHENLELLSKAACDKVTREFDSQLVAKKYIGLYKSIISSCSN